MGLVFQPTNHSNWRKQGDTKMVMRVLVRRNGVTTVRTFRSYEKASQWFEEQDSTCGNGSSLVDCSTSINLSTGVSVKRHEWENGDRMELVF